MNKIFIALLASTVFMASPSFSQGFPNPNNPNIQNGGNGNGNNGCGNGNGGNDGTNCHNGGGVITPPGNGGNGGNSGAGGAGGNGGTGYGGAGGAGYGGNGGTSVANSNAAANSNATGGSAVGVGYGGNANAVGVGGNATGGNSVANGGAGGSSSASTSNANNSSVNVEGDTYTQRRQVATAYAPSLAAGLGTCLGSTSAGGQTGIFGISFGRTHTDKNCVLIQQVSLLNSLGLRDAAVQRACADVDIRRAMASAGTACESFVFHPVKILDYIPPVTPVVVVKKDGELG